MKVFMLGWEFPPHISGGLGTACYGMTKGLSEIGVKVTFVLPASVPKGSGGHVTLRSATDLPAGIRKIVHQAGQPFTGLELYQLDALLIPYSTPETYDEEVRKLAEQMAMDAEMLEAIKALSGPTSLGLFGHGAGAHYAGDLMAQIYKYERLAVALARISDFDVIHAHDWMTFPAALHVKARTGKPMVVHVHSTEFDRSGDNINQVIYDIERAGMHGADKVVCVSHLTRNIAFTRYGVPAEKLEVVYNAVDLPSDGDEVTRPIRRNEKIVLFLGRVTMQKGPEYFLMAAKKVVEKFKNVRFIMAGSGDMITRMIRLAADLGIGRHVTFTGFLRGKDVQKVFQIADLYVMPSVSEPFGIAPLEALSHDVPVLISRQSGVSEVITHALKVDFWDIDQMADKILAVLRHAPLGSTLKQHGRFELSKLSWRDSAENLYDIYKTISGKA